MNSTSHRCDAKPTAAAARRGSLALRAGASGLVVLLVTSAFLYGQAEKPAVRPEGGDAAAEKQSAYNKLATQLSKKRKGAGGAPAAKPEAAKGATGKVRGMMVAKVAQPNREPLIQQFTTQGRPAVRAELILVRNVCELSLDEFRKIKGDSDAALKDVVTQLVDAQLQPRSRVMQKGQSTSMPDANKLLHDGLVAVMKKDLTPDQWSRYQSEVERRAAHRKRAAIRFLVDAIDRDLYLSEQQRARLEESLSSHWDDSWMMYLDYVLYGNQFFPQAVDQYLTPLLSNAQRRVWQGTQKVGNMWGFGGIWGGFVNDNDALEPELGAATKLAPWDAVPRPVGGQSGPRTRFGRIAEDAKAGQMMKAVIVSKQKPQGSVPSVERNEPGGNRGAAKKAENTTTAGKNAATEKPSVEDAPKS